MYLRQKGHARGGVSIPAAGLCCEAVEQSNNTWYGLLRPKSQLCTLPCPDAGCLTSWT